MAAIYNGRMDDVAFTCRSIRSRRRRGRLDPYWLVSAAASYKLQPGVELFARVENTLDQHYQEVFGFETPPLAAYAGVRRHLGWQPHPWRGRQ